MALPERRGRLRHGADALNLLEQHVAALDAQRVVEDRSQQAAVIVESLEGEVLREGREAGSQTPEGRGILRPEAGGRGEARGGSGAGRGGEARPRTRQFPSGPPHCSALAPGIRPMEHRNGNAAREGDARRGERPGAPGTAASDGSAG